MCIRDSVTAEPRPLDFPPFDPTLTKEQIARDEREMIYGRKIEAKGLECDALKSNLDAHKSHYYDNEESGDEEYQNYSNALEAYNDCLDKIDALREEMKTAPVDFGTSSEY